MATNIEVANDMIEVTLNVIYLEGKVWSYITNNNDPPPFYTHNTIEN